MPAQTARLSQACLCHKPHRASQKFASVQETCTGIMSRDLQVIMKGNEAPGATTESPTQAADVNPSSAA